ncbi:MAG: hypothetical protein BWY85_02432 [Firmicutes bacterium ADurb.Bin506]|nr:MAG: hypothetical protein BWY85_02432 [Firmicutes bacterium ADurb.Bin506]
MLRVVVTAGGAPASDVEVNVYDEHDEWIGSASQAADGRFELKLVPGTYRVEAYSWMDGYDSAEAHSVLVREGSTTMEIRLALPEY